MIPQASGLNKDINTKIFAPIRGKSEMPVDSSNNEINIQVVESIQDVPDDTLEVNSPSEIKEKSGKGFPTPLNIFGAF